MYESSLTNTSNILRLLISHSLAIILICLIPYIIRSSSQEIFSQDGEIEYKDYSAFQKIIDYLTIRWQILYFFVYMSYGFIETFKKLRGI